MNNLQIHYFIVTAKNQSFSKAAAELFITQPSLSKQIKIMEQELGAALFDRTKNPIELTRTGEKFFNFFLNYTGELARLREQAKEEAESYKEVLTIGIITGCRLPEEVRQKLQFVSSQYPQIKLVYENHTPHNLINLLRCYSIDACFIFADFLTGCSDIQYETLCKVKKYIVYSKTLLPDADKKIKISDFADKVFFCPDEDSADQTLRLMTTNCLKYNLYPTIRSMPNIESVMTNVAFGNGVAIVDALTQFNTSGDVEYYEIQPGYNFCLAWLPGEFSPELKKIRDFLLDPMVIENPKG